MTICRIAQDAFTKRIGGKCNRAGQVAGAEADAVRCLPVLKPRPPPSTDTRREIHPDNRTLRMAIGNRALKLSHVAQLPGVSPFINLTAINRFRRDSVLLRK